MCYSSKKVTKIFCLARVILSISPVFFYLNLLYIGQSICKPMGWQSNQSTKTNKIINFYCFYKEVNQSQPSLIKPEDRMAAVSWPTDSLQEASPCLWHGIVTSATPHSDSGAILSTVHLAQSSIAPLWVILAIQ